jgi:hypothetical protein
VDTPVEGRQALDIDVWPDDPRPSPAIAGGRPRGVRARQNQGVSGSEYPHLETRQRWGATVFRRVAASVVSLLWLLLAVSVTFNGNPGTATVVWILEVAVVVGSWRLVFVPYLEAGPDELTVRNGIKTIAIPWTRIKTITPGWGGLTILQTDGRVKTALAVQKANIATWTNQLTRADDIAGVLMDRVNGAGVFLDPQPGRNVGPVADHGDRFWNGATWVSTTSDDGRFHGSGRPWVGPPESEDDTDPQR